MGHRVRCTFTESEARSLITAAAVLLHPGTVIVLKKNQSDALKRAIPKLQEGMKRPAPKVDV